MVAKEPLSRFTNGASPLTRMVSFVSPTTKAKSMRAGWPKFNLTPLRAAV